MALKILVVDDEPDILEFIRYNLQKEGYDVSVAHNGKEALDEAVRLLPDLIIMDMMMPVMDGKEACRRMRMNPLLNDTMIIFLSAVSSERAQIKGYQAGADDYIAKPVSMRVLCSRVRAIANRMVPKLDEETVLNHNKRTYLSSVGEVHLPKKEFALLDMLLSSKDKVVSREELFSKVWGEEVVVGPRTLDVHIRRLRRKVGDATIETVKGVGFRYVSKKN